MDPEKKDDLGRQQQQQQQQTEVYSLSDTSESDDKAIDVKTGQISHSQQPPATLNGHHAHGSSQGPSGGLSEESLAALSRHTTEASHVSSDGQHADGEGDFRGASMSRARTGTSFGSTASRMPEHEVTFDEGGSSSSSSDGDEDKSSSNSDNPRDWPLWYRGWVLFCIAFSTWVVVLYSTSYTASIPGLMLEFDVADQTIATLGVTSYLVGLAVGSLVLAPLSELYGRRPVYLVCMACFTVLVIPTGLATSLVEIIVVRFFGAVFGAAMISNSPGTVVDISTEQYRALCMSLFSIAPFNGPVTGPLIGGFIYQAYGWRWDNWLVLILGAVAFGLMFTVRETYAPAILRAKAKRRRKETGDDRWWSRYDEAAASKVQLFRENMARPFVLAVTEPILWFFNLWISLIYGILYLCFVAYPIVFSQHRGWGPGTSGLAFVGIGIGTLLSIAAEPLLRRLINSHPKDPATGRVAPEASASAMVIGAVLAATGQLVFAWTSLPVSIHWAVPIAAGIPFGAGNTLVFIYGSSYLTSAYGIYSASAMAGNAVVRSLFGGTLPLAGAAMYAALSPRWAGTLLGLLEVIFIPIPVAFYKYGDRIRARSPVIRRMREEEEENEAKRARRLARALRRQERGDAAALERSGVGRGADIGGGNVVENDATAGDAEKGTAHRGQVAI
ncbi:hypothetical protein MCOR27_000719 [Pyricularia oryzae]|uniref:Major facilitator superfamily (MFS) profile domain-containing protein n=2 Tax=Pyricularia TaxID=48558 RepID=A0ABQ8ND97_PYRGI|nr:hypothetical protein MCOR01_011800 [Pyricularia oryzae]KAI6295209.1 hypothetical protein MCOR33_007828 [Pyricularia grisea]KAH9432316.1 hypothetical protein MCOR02_007019 [Pyricularia oryzae]KAI6258272.1 hypothetical protein MCOR19_005370 [Pyricularia oryzae]KAI6277841.1 hypothetical protein MCOR26_004916 [Pyricularia oryzae]